MSSRDLASLAISPRHHFSRWLIAFLLVTSIGVAYAGLPALLATVTAISLLLTAVWQAWRLGLLGRRYQIESIHCDGQAQWWLVPSDGQRLEARLRPCSRLSTEVIFAGWDTERGLFRSLLLRHHFAPREWRELQARMRLLPLNTPNLALPSSAAGEG